MAPFGSVRLHGFGHLPMKRHLIEEKKILLPTEQQYICTFNISTFKSFCLTWACTTPPIQLSFFKLDTRMFDPQINRSAPPGCLSACFPSPRSHDSTHPTASPVTLSICHSPALCTSPPLSFCSPSLQSGCYLYTLKKKRKVTVLRSSAFVA